MFRKIRNLIQTAIFLYTLLRAAQGWAMLAKESFEEARFQIARRKNRDLTRFQHKHKF